MEWGADTDPWPERGPCGGGLTEAQPQVCFVQRPSGGRMQRLNVHLCPMSPSNCYSVNDILLLDIFLRIIH